MQRRNALRLCDDQINNPNKTIYQTINLISMSRFNIFNQVHKGLRSCLKTIQQSL